MTPTDRRRAAPGNFASQRRWGQGCLRPGPYLRTSWKRHSQKFAGTRILASSPGPMGLFTQKCVEEEFSAVLYLSAVRPRVAARHACYSGGLCAKAAGGQSTALGE
jgi:hypothetical protein